MVGRWGRQEGRGPARGEMGTSEQGWPGVPAGAAAPPGCQRQGGLDVRHVLSHGSGGWRWPESGLCRGPSSWLADGHLLTVSSCDLAPVSTRGGLATSASPLLLGPPCNRIRALPLGPQL